MEHGYTPDLFADPPPVPVAQRKARSKALVSTGGFYNTIGVKGHELAKRQAKAGSQESKLIEFFQTHPDGAFAPSYLAALLFPNSPPTSIRRALSCLTKADRLEKTAVQVIGPWGEPEHLWRLIPNQLEGKP